MTFYFARGKGIIFTFSEQFAHTAADRGTYGPAWMRIDLSRAESHNGSMYCDAHIHLVDLEEREHSFASTPLPFPWRAAVVTHAHAEFTRSEALRRLLPPTIAGFGIHPQNPDMRNAAFLSSLCAARGISFIGEAGFDFFGDSAITTREPDAARIQTEAFLFQVRLAASAGLPLVVHARKATDMLMGYGRELAAVPAVIFHCWPGRLEEARMFLKKGINAYFSFGTPILRDSRHAIESLRGIPCSRILSETDAPWQPPHGSPWSRREDIIAVVDKMAKVLEMSSSALLPVLEQNFVDAYLLHGMNRDSASCAGSETQEDSAHNAERV